MFNKEEAACLRNRGTEIAQKMSEVCRATAGLPTGRVEAVSRTVDAVVLVLNDAILFLQKFSERGAFAKLCQGTLDARRFYKIDKRLCELSLELGSALDLQSLALQVQRFQNIDMLIDLLGRTTVDAANASAARDAALLCGIERNSAFEREALATLGVGVDQLLVGQGRLAEGQVELRAMLSERNVAASGAARARQDKERALEAFEVELDACEATPFARGGLSQVHLGKYQGEQVAVKRLSLVGLTAVARAKVLAAFSTELAIMTKLRSPRCVSVVGVVTTDASWLGLILEFMAGGTLRDALDTPHFKIDEPMRRNWLLDVALGMQYLYSKGIQHRDLKTPNILLDATKTRAKITDYGLSRSADLTTAATIMQTSAQGTAKGTPAYMAPELLDSNTFTEKTDVFAFAIVIWEVLTGRIPWEGLNAVQIGMQYLVRQSRPPSPGAAPHDLVQLMWNCWEQDPDNRPDFCGIRISLSTPGYY